MDAIMKGLQEIDRLVQEEEAAEAPICEQPCAQGFWSDARVKEINELMAAEEAPHLWM